MGTLLTKRAYYDNYFSKLIIILISYPIHIQVTLINLQAGLLVFSALGKSHARTILQNQK